ncbi:MAG: cell division protein SepF [Clostridia bacterium]|nr:cell division protein SepF [Clostridia bacterium]MDD7482494.1 cell division protein SepF [Clostridia bacterium]MDY5558962.1 cell division protein SepF [Candidatus Heritagella sp.]
MSLVDSFKKMWNPPEDEYEDDYVDVYANSEPAASGHEEPKKEESRETVRRAAPQTSGNKVVNIHATAQLQVVLFKPEHFGEEIRAIADELLKMHTVVLNLEHTEESVSRRIIDFLSGVTYANKGKIKPVASNTFIITPYNVDLTGDEVVDELENNGVYF